MIEVRLLGEFSVQCAGANVRFRSRKYGALLAYLVANAGRSVSRDALASLLWGDSPDVKARHSLSQALYSLSRTLPSLGLDTSAREEVSISEECVQSDLHRLRDALRRGDADDIVRCYGGTFLHGFWVPGAPEFEEWRETTHTQLVRSIEAVLSPALRRAEAEADWRGAEEIADCLISLDPLDEDLHCRRATAIAAGGDHGRAARELRRLERYLRKELGRSLNPRTTALVESLTSTDLDRLTAGEEEAASHEHRPPFLGRSGEFAALREEWDRVKSGNSRTVLVLGEAGIGKTRLCHRLLRLAAVQGGRLLQSRCHEIESRLPYVPITDALADGVRPEDLQALSPAWAAAAAELLPQVAADELTGEAAPRSGKEAPRRRLYEAIARILEFVSAQAPAVLFIDDYQWADDSTVALLHYLTRRLAASHLLFLLAVRTDELRNDSAVRLLIERETGDHLRRVHVMELDPRTSLELVDWFVEQQGIRLSPGTKELIVAQSAGRPFFLLETLRAIQAGELPVSASGEPQAKRPRVLLPASLEESLAARLRALPTAAQEVLNALAVLGKAASHAVLRGVSGQPIDLVLQGVDELLRCGFIRDDSNGIRIRHDLVREAAYRSIAGARRRVLHGRAAQFLRRTKEGQAGTIALHYDLAGIKPPAYRYALKAAEASDRLHAPAEAEFFLRMAAANATTTQQQFAVEERLARFLLRNRRFQEADRLLADVVARSRASSDLRMWISARVDRLAARGRLGLVAARDLIGQLRELTVDMGSLRDPILEVDLLRMIAATAHNAGDIPTVRGVMQQLLQLADKNESTTSGIRALTTAATMIGLYDRVSHGLECSERAIAVARRSGDIPIIISALLARARNRLQSGYLEGAHADLQEALALGERFAVASYAFEVLNDLAVVKMELGDLTGALGTLDRASIVALEAEALHDMVFVWTNTSLAHLERGDVESAVEAAMSALSCNATVGAWWGSATALAVLGLHALERGQLSEANRCRREILALFEGRDFWVGDFSYAEMFLARLAAVEGEEEKGLVRLDRAVAAYEGRDAMCWSRLQLERARLLLSLDRAEARRTARRVRSRAARAGARPLVAKAEAILDRLMVKE